MTTTNLKKLKAIGAFRKFQKDSGYRNRRAAKSDKPNVLHRNRTGKLRRKDLKPSQCINLRRA